MAKSETQLFRLFQLLNNAKFGHNTVVLKTTIVSELNIKEASVPVYIHSLKKKFGAVIENVTDENSRLVVGYTLKNNPDVPQFKRSVVGTKKPVVVVETAVSEDGSVPILDLDDEQYSDREIADTVQAIGYTPGDY